MDVDKENCKTQINFTIIFLLLESIYLIYCKFIGNIYNRKKELIAFAFRDDNVFEKVTKI